MPYATPRRSAGDVDERFSPPAARCCCPSGCVVGEAIDARDPDDAVKVICSNHECPVSHWIHHVCFEGWEHQIQSVLRNSGRTRGWTDKQRLGNLWAKRGYDLPTRACDCPCGRGHLRKDTDYVPVLRTDEESNRRRLRRRGGGRQLPQMGRDSSVWQSPAASADSTRPRSRTLSLGSVASVGVWGRADGNSPPKHTSRKSNSTGDANGYFDDMQVKTTGSIFQRRDSLSNFYQVLPRWKVNGIYIKLEDDCPQGNDDTRIFLLTNLGDQNRREMACLLCNAPLAIYDRYPLIEGTFFLSPINHAMLGLGVRYDGRDRYLLAAYRSRRVSPAHAGRCSCMGCLEHKSERLACLRCGARRWFLGNRLTLGGLYSFDILSTSPCCAPECRRCRQPVPFANGLAAVGHQDFSAFSAQTACGACGLRDYHFVRRLDSFRVLSDAALLERQASERSSVASSADDALGHGLLEAIEMDPTPPPIHSPLVVA